jgi:PAS domain S-box-containing protein
VFGYANGGERSLALRREDVIGRDIAELLVPPGHRAHFRRALARDGFVATEEFTATSADGIDFPAELVVTPVPASDSPRFVGLVRDVTEPLRANALMRDSLARERKAHTVAETRGYRSGRLLAQVLAAEDRERGRLSGALHDGPVQILHTAQLELSRAARGDSNALARAERRVSGALEKLREAIVALHPPALDRIGLPASLREIADAVAHLGGPRVDLQVTGSPEGIHDRLILSLCRELLLNTMRHAEADEAVVRLYSHRDQLVLEVEDEGVGLTEERRREALAEGHIGLAWSAERVEALGGSFDVESSRERGTLIRARLPARRLSDRQAMRANGEPKDDRLAGRPEWRKVRP